MKRFPVLFLAAVLPAAANDPVPDFSDVYRLLDERCIECHTADDPEASLVLETYDGLLKGGESGKAIEPGKAAESLLIKFVRGEVMKDGKRKFMPPGKREKLGAEDVQLIAKWIDAGAKPSAGVVKKTLDIPKVAPKIEVRTSVNALAYSGTAKLLAVGRYQGVDLIDPDNRSVVRKLGGLKGAVTSVLFSPDGSTLFAASGENAVEGEVRSWRVGDGALLRTISGHRDTIYALALSPDGKTLATGSYDQQIKLWNAETGTELKTLRGHNGAVFGLAFRPDGKILASASADRTVKLWETSTGQRRDTFVQPLKDQVAVAWSADGKRLAAAGFDNRIRVWEVSAEARETTNPLLIARYAHEQPVSRLTWSADGATLASASQDGTVKLWDGNTIKERVAIQKLENWPSALSFADTKLFVGAIDGSLAAFAIADGKPVTPSPPASSPQISPKVTGISPRAVQSGRLAYATVIGTNLSGVKGFSASDARIRVEIAEPAKSESEVRVSIETPEGLPRGTYDIQAIASSSSATAGTLKLYIDDLPVVEGSAVGSNQLELPVSLWGALKTAGTTERYQFAARRDQTLVFDLAAKSIGSKADAVLTLSDLNGRVLATNNQFDSTGDPFIAYSFKEDGAYVITVSDLQMTGSADHLYRLNIGELPFVVACFPMSVRANSESEVTLVGYNIPATLTAKVKAGEPGEMVVPLDTAKFRTRRLLKVMVSALPALAEAEPNDRPDQPAAVTAPCTIGGRIQSNGDADLFRFAARKGSVWAIETQAAQRGSPVDTKLEVLDRAGNPVPRLLFQAVRDSAITFRAIDSVTPDTRVENWREMELNQFLYMNGEVAKIFRMPEGPDSGFQFYSFGGKRVAYFNTTATAHPLDEPCYIVEPLNPGTKLIQNGLPSFPLYFENDDDGERKLGIDSRILFTAPADGDYLVRVIDSRGMGGAEFVYQLVIREAQPEFSVSLAGANKSVNARSGQEFVLNADRKDGFDQPIVVDITNVPTGYQVTSPLIIEPGHSEARGTVHALPSATAADDKAWAGVKITARAGEMTHSVNNLGKVTLAKEPQVEVALEPAAPGDTLEKLSPPTPIQEQTAGKPFEITISPGEIIPAWIKIRRNGASGDIRFDVQNLPHGVIVDNLGLNGITLLAAQNEGEIQIRAEPWVQEMDRLIFAKTRGFGEQTSLPVLLHVRKKENASRTLTVK